VNATITSCRSCGNGKLEPILDLGLQPLANALPTTDRFVVAEDRYPLKLVLCSACSLAQITETVSSETLFRDYLYFSSFSETMLAHAGDLAARLTGERSLGSESLVVEVASNDGYLLQFYKAAGVPVLGIEPARNVARWAEENRGIPTIVEFFNEPLARKLAAEGHSADVIHAHNVMAHVDDLNGFVAGLEALLKPGGIALIEAPYLIDMIAQTEFDTIYHEHLCYFSATAVDLLFRRHGLMLVDVERIAIHGGTLRMVVGRVGASAGRSPAVDAILVEEGAWGVGRIESYRPFARRVEGLRDSLRSLLADLKGQGHRLAAYGASAKGSTLLNYFGIGRETLDFVADRSTVKQGRFTPGTLLPIHSAEAILQERPDYVLLLTWNFKDEILRQQQPYRDLGGKFIIPISELSVV
jgi:SAM-dependent methyltransferase